MIAQLRRRLREPAGYSVPEMLVSVAVLSIFFALFATVMSTTMTQSSQEQAATVLQSDARAAMERFARELRQAHSGDGTWPIQSVTPATNTILFLSPDRLAPFHLRQIEWRLSSGELQRRSITSTDTNGPPWVWPGEITAAAWATEARSIRNTTIFQFLDGAEPAAATTVPANVRRVVITLEVSSARQANRKFTYTTSVTPRVSV